MKVFLNIACLNGLEVVCEVSNSEWAIFTVIVFFVTAPMALIENFRKFVIFNFLCLTSLIMLSLYPVFVAAHIWVTPGRSTLVDLDFEYQLFGLKDLIKFFGLTNVSFENVALVFPIKNKMRNQSDFNSIFIYVNILISALVISLCASTYYVRHFLSPSEQNFELVIRSWIYLIQFFRFMVTT